MLPKKELLIDLVCNIGSRRKNNEDIIYVGGEFFRDKAVKRQYKFSSNVRFATVVADGMGGHQWGEMASELATKSFDEFLIDIPPSLTFEELEDALRQWTKEIHAIIVNFGKEHRAYDGMGTTFCGLFFYESYIVAMNIGDSRLYRFRDNVLKQISIDHSMWLLTGDKSIPINQIYNSLGAGDDAFIDIKNISSQCLSGDCFLICSDGLYDMISDLEIENILIKKGNAQKLVDSANEAGGNDNISVLLLSIEENKEGTKEEDNVQEEENVEKEEIEGQKIKKGVKELKPFSLKCESFIHSL